MKIKVFRDGSQGTDSKKSVKDWDRILEKKVNNFLKNNTIVNVFSYDLDGVIVVFKEGDLK